MITLIAIAIGFALDLLLGDPPRCPHLVVGMGRLIERLEHLLRKVVPPTPRGELAGGAILALLLPAISFAVDWGVLILAGLLHPLLRLVLESLLCWQCLALRSLGQAGAAVQKALEQENLPLARAAVGRVVGRDTEALDEAGVIRAAVETVAENTSDGVIAPLFYLALGGAPLGVLYKAINTMDSMVGYRNEKYQYFGASAARLDDAANFLPARLAGLLMIAAAPCVGLNATGAWRIFWRDRLQHQSPNAAHTEAAAAGALGIQLGGSACYFGKVVAKPTIGEALCPPQAADIGRVISMLYCSGIFALLLGLALRGVVLWF